MGWHRTGLVHFEILKILEDVGSGEWGVGSEELGVRWSLCGCLCYCHHCRWWGFPMAYWMLRAQGAETGAEAGRDRDSGDDGFFLFPTANCRVRRRLSWLTIAAYLP